MTSILGDARLTLLQRALDGLSQRQQAVANNIANIDTPGYRRTDAPFEATLRTASASSVGTQLATTKPGHISAGPSSTSLLSMGGGADGARSTSTRNDGNNVDLDYEMTRLADTTLRYDTLAQATSSRFAMLRNIVGHGA